MPSQAEFFTEIIFSLVSPDTIFFKKNTSVLSTYWITHRVVFLFVFFRAQNRDLGL